MTLGPADRDWQTLRNIAMRALCRAGVNQALANNEAEHFAYVAAEILARLLEEQSDAR